MKTRLNITIEQELLENMKAYSMRKQISLSQMIEDHFEKLIKSSIRRENIVAMVEQLDPSKQVIKDSSRKEFFYEDQKKKYGF
jgi:hypothetical protein